MPDPRPAPPHIEVDPHLEEDHYAPSRTMVQGTQEYGVEHGHEEEDIQGRVILRWWIGLGAFLFASQILMWAMFGFLQRREAAADAALQPPPFAAITSEPPEPRLLPNPVDARREPYEPVEGPMEYGQEQLLLERRQMEALGLWDMETNRPVISPEVAQSVAAETSGGQTPAGELQRLPTDGSGGLLLEENALR